MAIYQNACPKCKGTVQHQILPGEDGPELRCISCGWRPTVAPPPGVPDPKAGVDEAYNRGRVGNQVELSDEDASQTGANMIDSVTQGFLFGPSITGKHPQFEEGKKEDEKDTSTSALYGTRKMLTKLFPHWVNSLQKGEDSQFDYDDGPICSECGDENCDRVCETRAAEKQGRSWPTE